MLGNSKIDRLKQGCKKCGSNEWKLGVMRTASGSIVYPYVCSDCGTRSQIYEKKDIAMQHDLTNVENNPSVKPCRRCGSLEGSELHHWAPSYIFGADAETWPMDYLCRKCHKEWHLAISKNHRP